jgi:twitching motility protein PilT
MGFTYQDFKCVLQLAIDESITDIFLKVGLAPMFKGHGRQTPCDFDALSQADLETIVKWLLPNILTTNELNQINDADISYTLDNVGRFKVNIVREAGKFGYFSVVLRVIPLSIKSFSELNLPDIILEICNRPGLALITGSTGMGKSTTLAAMLKQLYSTDEYHIVTLENSIEHLHFATRGIITQRELKSNFSDYTRALKAALRQSADIIMTGEIPNAEVLNIALDAAESGIKVFSAMDTEYVISTLERLISYYPDDEKSNIASRLAENLNGIFSLKLLNSNVQPGRIPATEFILNEGSISEYLRNRDWLAISSLMKDSPNFPRVRAFDSDIQDLYRYKEISYQVAISAITQKSSIKNL